MAGHNVSTHVIFWLLYWLSQSLLMGEGKHLNFYLPKEAAMVSLQIVIVYFNWNILYPIFFLAKKYVVYLVACILLIYFIFILSFTWIDFVLGALHHLLPIVEPFDFPPIQFKYSFWAFLSGSAPYSLALVVSLALKISYENTRNKQLVQELELAKNQTEIQYLRSQINPHFLFNSLNNIHSLILVDQVKASKYTILLSNLLRYMIYEVQKDETELENEIVNLTNYFNIVRLRSEKKENLRFTHQVEDTSLPLAPLLLISLLENGIKHSGISFDESAWLAIDLKEKNGFLEVNMENSIRESSQELNKKNKALMNAPGPIHLKQRLELIYPNRFHFDFKIRDATAYTRLKLDLNP